MRSNGLWAFLLAIGVDVIALIIDGLLAWAGLPTISDWVWWAPWLGAPILAWQGMGVGGLALHFYARK